MASGAKKFTVRMVLEIPGNVDEQDVKQYVHDAVRRWGGSKPPEDPFFGLRHEDVKITTVRRWSTNRRPKK